MKTLWPKFDFHWIYSLKVDEDSNKIWKLSETDHTHIFAPKVKQISQNFSWKHFWSPITPHRKLWKVFNIPKVLHSQVYFTKKKIRLFKRKLLFYIRKHWKFNFFSLTFNLRIFFPIFRAEYGVKRLKGQLGTKFKSKIPWTTYKIPIFIMFWVSVWVLGLFEYGSRSQISTNLQNFLWIWSSISRKFIIFAMLKWLFSKIYVENSTEKQNVPSLNLICKLLVVWTWLQAQIWQFLIATEIYMGHYLEAIRDTELNFSGFSYLTDANTRSKFHQKSPRDLIWSS